jgi:hypothetical protein
MDVRRIRHDEAERVAGLWDDMVDGVLRPRGRANITAMLTLSATSPHAATFVAEEDGELRGFVLAELADDGLLPARYGKVQELCGPRELLPDLVTAAVAWLREQDVECVRAEAEEDDPEAIALLTELGWEREAVRFAMYPGEQGGDGGP